MKYTLTIWLTGLFILAGCAGENKQSPDGFIVVDINARYPKKELVLQDFMDVKYIALETLDDFVCQNLVVALGKNRIIIRNYPEDGDIFIFDRSGKALKKINNRGQGAEEYNVYRQIVLDEDKGELFVNDRPSNRVMVYDLDGNYKRVLKQEDKINYSYMYNFDHDKLICNNDWDESKKPFAIISKEDGHFIEEIEIPFKEKIQLYVELKIDNKNYTIESNAFRPILPNLDKWILVDQSSDTIYSYQYGQPVTPIIVRTPPVRTMDPEIFLFPGMFTDRYYFMDASKKRI